MKSIDKKIYYKKFATVIVNDEPWDKPWDSTLVCVNCNTNLQEFSIFLGDEIRLSTLYSSCCGSCLSTIVKKASEKGRKYAEVEIKNAENQLYKDSLEYVRKVKMEKINKYEVK